MDTTILELITKYGMNTVIIATVIFVLTGLIKKPIKLIAKKMEDGSKLTRFITFLPIIIGFGITAIYEFIMTRTVLFDGNYYTLWLTSSSLSLAIYAFAEKFIPSKTKILSEEEVKNNKALIETLKDKLQVKTEEISNIVEEPLVKEEADVAQPTNISEENLTKQKIILRGHVNGQATPKEE